MVLSVQALDNGQAVYVGRSDNGSNSVSATYWFDPGNPIAASGSSSEVGTLRDVSTSGVLVGANNNVASIGNFSQPLQPLAGNISGGAFDVTSDASYIAGDALWRLNATTGSYELVDTSGFELPTNGLSLPTEWVAAEIDPVVGDAVFGAFFLDALTFTNQFGFWRADGTFLFAADGAEEFSDFEVYDGQLVAGLNLNDDGVLYSITDGSSLTINGLTGNDALFSGSGLYQGSAGLVLTAPGGGSFVTSYSTTAVPEPSAFALATVGCVGLLFHRRRSGRANTPSHIG